jgi:hypothetical protein
LISKDQKFWLHNEPLSTLLPPRSIVLTKNLPVFCSGLFRSPHSFMSIFGGIRTRLREGVITWSGKTRSRVHCRAPPRSEVLVSNLSGLPLRSSSLPPAFSLPGLHPAVVSVIPTFP